jgi:hypothetical protein
MSKFLVSATVRSTLVSLALGTPAAYGQTPQDLARLMFGQNPQVTSVSTAPAVTSDFAGHGSAADIARLVAPSGAAVSISSAPRNEAVFATAGGSADLARLAGVGGAASESVQRMASVDHIVR